MFLARPQASRALDYRSRQPIARVAHLSFQLPSARSNFRVSLMTLSATGVDVQCPGSSKREHRRQDRGVSADRSPDDSRAPRTTEIEHLRSDAGLAADTVHGGSCLRTGGSRSPDHSRDLSHKRQHSTGLDNGVGEGRRRSGSQPGGGSVFCGETAAAGSGSRLPGSQRSDHKKGNQDPSHKASPPDGLPDAKPQANGDRGRSTPQGATRSSAELTAEDRNVSPTHRDHRPNQGPDRGRSSDSPPDSPNLRASRRPRSSAERSRSCSRSPGRGAHRASDDSPSPGNLSDRSPGSKSRSGSGSLSKSGSRSISGSGRLRISDPDRSGRRSHDDGDEREEAADRDWHRDREGDLGVRSRDSNRGRSRRDSDALDRDRPDRERSRSRSRSRSQVRDREREKERGRDREVGRARLRSRERDRDVGERDRDGGREREHRKARGDVKEPYDTDAAAAAVGDCGVGDDVNERQAPGPGGGAARGPRAAGRRSGGAASAAFQEGSVRKGPSPPSASQQLQQQKQQRQQQQQQQHPPAATRVGSASSSARLLVSFSDELDEEGGLGGGATAASAGGRSGAARGAGGGAGTAPFGGLAATTAQRFLREEAAQRLSIPPRTITTTTANSGLGLPLSLSYGSSGGGAVARPASFQSPTTQVLHPSTYGYHQQPSAAAAVGTAGGVVNGSGAAHAHYHGLSLGGAAAAGGVGSGSAVAAAAAAALEAPSLSIRGGSPPSGGTRTLGRVLFGMASARCARPYMEDRHCIVQSLHPLSSSGQPLQDGVPRSLAAIYDGHNGTRAADTAAARLHKLLAADAALRTHTGELAPPAAMAAEEAAIAGALRRCFRRLDDEILAEARADGARDGATALVVMRLSDTLYAAHAGDSRAVLSRGGTAVRLTEDHKPHLPAEKARVEAAGGRVDFQRCWRVIVEPREGRLGSGLAVSRSLGDLDFKEPRRFVECEPDVRRLVPLPGDNLVVMGSDGLWDVMSDQEAVDTANAALQARHARMSFAAAASAITSAFSGGGSSTAAAAAAYRDEDARAVAEALLEAAVRRGTADNVTVVVMLLQWD